MQISISGFCYLGSIFTFQNVFQILDKNPVTLPKTNISPEKLPSQKENSLSTTIIQG